MKSSSHSHNKTNFSCKVACMSHTVQLQFGLFVCIIIMYNKLVVVK